jgi:prepilin-type N-terminal cleavage/methylation domain-containing protein
MTLSASTTRRGERGFTLIELLVVMGILAIAAAIAIPMFATQRQKAEDTEAKALVRSAAIAVEAANVDRRDFRLVTEAMIHAIDPSLSVSDTPQAKDSEITFTPDGAMGYAVATESVSGKTFELAEGPGGQSRTCYEGERPAEPTCTW